MSTTDDPFFATAFFDEPNLLAVRFSRRAGDRVAAFAVHRSPDAGSGISTSGVLKVIGVGVLAVCIGLPMMRGCSGSSSSTARPTIIGATTSDNRQSPNWKQGLDRLGDDLAPRRADLLPFHVRTLLDIPRELVRYGDATGGWLQPRCTHEDRLAYLRGTALAKMLVAAGAGRDLAVILDLPGPAAVAAATGMADRFDPVFTCDNLPHPAGVVPSAQTLAAVVHWRADLLAARMGRSNDAPAVFVLEGERLAPYHNEVDRFDNRSAAKLPNAAALNTLGVSRILYVREHRGDVSEADDLNELFTALTAAGVGIRHLALDSMDVATHPPETAPSTYQPHHWFWNNYGWYRPAGTTWGDATDQDARYRTASRATMFSGGPLRQNLDGGNRYRPALLDRLAPPPPPDTRSGGSSSGGSWSRSSGSSWS